jgi:hypothetical protein
MQHLRAYLVNICAVIQAQFVCDLSLQDIRTPAMFIMAHTFALHLSSASMHDYLKNSNRPHKPLVLCGIKMIDQLSILLMHPLHHTKNAFLLSNDRLAKITTDKIREAFELLDNCVSTLLKFECGTGTIPSCPLLKLMRPRQRGPNLIRPQRDPQASTPVSPG